jgi:hypothetical protein
MDDFLLMLIVLTKPIKPHNFLELNQKIIKAQKKFEKTQKRCEL